MCRLRGVLLLISFVLLIVAGGCTHKFYDFNTLPKAKVEPLHLTLLDSVKLKFSDTTGLYFAEPFQPSGYVFLKNYRDELQFFLYSIKDNFIESSFILEEDSALNYCYPLNKEWYTVRSYEDRIVLHRLNSDFNSNKDSIVFSTRNLHGFFTHFGEDEKYIYTLSTLKKSNVYSRIDKETGEVKGFGSILSNALYSKQELGLTRAYVDENKIWFHHSSFPIIEVYSTKGKLIKSYLLSFPENDQIYPKDKSEIKTTRLDPLKYTFARKGHTASEYFYESHILHTSSAKKYCLFLYDISNNSLKRADLPYDYQLLPQDVGANKIMVFNTTSKTIYFYSYE